MMQILGRRDAPSIRLKPKVAEYPAGRPTPTLSRSDRLSHRRRVSCPERLTLGIGFTRYPV